MRVSPRLPAVVQPSGDAIEGDWIHGIAQTGKVVGLHGLNPLVLGNGIEPGADHIPGRDPPASALALPAGTNFQVEDADQAAGLPPRVHNDRVHIAALGVASAELAGHKAGRGLAVDHHAAVAGMTLPVEAHSEAAAV